MPVGIAMALLIGPLLEGWRPFWLANAGLAVVAAVLVVLLVRRDDQTTERLSWRGVGSDARATTMAGGPLMLAGSFVLYKLRYFAFVGFLLALLIERMKRAIVTAGMLTS